MHLFLIFLGLCELSDLYSGWAWSAFGIPTEPLDSLFLWFCPAISHLLLRCFHTAHFCDFFELPKACSTLKGHLKSKVGRYTNGSGERPHAFQKKSQKYKISASLFKYLSWQDLVTRVRYLKKMVLFPLWDTMKKKKTSMYTSVGTHQTWDTLNPQHYEIFSDSTCPPSSQREFTTLSVLSPL